MRKLKRTDVLLVQNFAGNGPVGGFLAGLGLSESSRQKYLLGSLMDSLASENSVLMTGGPGDNVILRLEYLPWDSEMLGVPTARLEKFQRINAPDWSGNEREKLIDMAIAEARQRKVRFLHAKFPADEVGWINTLEEKNFRVKDNEVVLLHNQVAIPPPDSDVSIRCISRQEPVPGLEEIASLFSRSRLANDHHIDQTRVVNLWKTSLDNCCRGFADRVYLAQNGRKKTAGILALMRTDAGDETIFRIHLLGVKPALQGKGIGAALVTAALHHVSGHSPFFTVETQTHNYNALGFYYKTGFDRVLESRISLHCWL